MRMVSNSTTLFESLSTVLHTGHITPRSTVEDTIIARSTAIRATQPGATMCGDLKRFTGVINPS